MRLAPAYPPPAASPCAACASGPKGIAGHEELFSQTMGSDFMHFRCRACGSLWMRSADAALRYTWKRAEQVFGADTPGKSGMAPP